jgi:uncharacterized lipoprotein YehR (DUF1307 family)
MAYRRSARVRAGSAVALAAVVLMFVLAACGASDDPYSGTWKATVDGKSSAITIEKDGDSWLISSADDPNATKVTATEVDGKLTITSSGGQPEVTYTRSGDDIIMDIHGDTYTLTKE